MSQRKVLRKVKGHRKTQSSQHVKLHSNPPGIGMSERREENLHFVARQLVHNDDELGLVERS